MTDFRAGDRVRIVHYNGARKRSRYAGRFGVVLAPPNHRGYIAVDVDGLTVPDGLLCVESELELVK